MVRQYLAKVPTKSVESVSSAESVGRHSRQTELLDRAENLTVSPK